MQVWKTTQAVWYKLKDCQQGTPQKSWAWNKQICLSTKCQRQEMTNTKVIYNKNTVNIQEGNVSYISADITSSWIHHH